VAARQLVTGISHIRGTARVSFRVCNRSCAWDYHFQYVRCTPSQRLLDNSRTGHFADWTTHGCHRRLCVLSFRSFGGICKTASCPVRELAYPRVVQLPSQTWDYHQGGSLTLYEGKRAQTTLWESTTTLNDIARGANT